MPFSKGHVFFVAAGPLGRASGFLRCGSFGKRAPRAGGAAKARLSEDLGKHAVPVAGPRLARRLIGAFQILNEMTLELERHASPWGIVGRRSAGLPAKLRQSRALD